jgi:hypothetical protein
MKRLFVLLSLLLAAVAGPAWQMQAAPRETSENPPDLVAQFRGMDSRPEILGFRSKGYSLALGLPTTTHYQGIVRRPGAGVPYFFVSRSGMGDGDEGNIMVVRMGSRRTDGERLRSNRLAKGKNVWETAPDSDDRVVHHWDPGWKHVGSLAIVGDVLAVALEEPIGANKTHEGAVWFYDVSSPDVRGRTLYPRALGLRPIRGVAPPAHRVAGRKAAGAAWPGSSSGLPARRDALHPHGQSHDVRHAALDPVV